MELVSSPDPVTYAICACAVKRGRGGKERVFADPCWNAVGTNNGGILCLVVVTTN